MLESRVVFQETISWFKLHESINKNEREKALVAFRLLSYSLESESFKYQILGNLYVFLEENKLALESYCKALDFAYQLSDWFGIGLIIYYIKRIDTNMADKYISIYKNKLNKNFINLVF